MHHCVGDTVFLGYLLPPSTSEPELYVGAYEQRHAWFNEERFQEGVKAWNEGTRKDCPVTFHEFGHRVVVSTCVKTAPRNESLEKYVPKDYTYPQDYQGTLAGDKWVQPSRKRCEESVRQFRQLEAKGIESAVLDMGWFSPGKIVVVSLNGSKHKIRL